MADALSASEFTTGLSGPLSFLVQAFANPIAFNRLTRPKLG